LYGDENTRFFHASATQRRRKNTIKLLEQNGVEHTSHAAKETILHDFYTDHLGSSVNTSWSFSLTDLYPSPSIPGHLISSPFSRDEIRAALFAMDRNSSPGPDGFGPSFYCSFWPQLEPAVTHLFDAFHSGTLELDTLNRAHLVLLPKKEAARTPDAYRPISLQNCPMKLFTKVMSNRVRPYITSLVAGDQTGFVHGRNITENFVYAADLLACCHKRKLPTIALKLDFRKAFDSIAWDSLLGILSARGFDSTWCGWAHSVLATGKTSILLNGVPGRWLSCRRGLRQGDPLSPFLFIVVADVLQRLAHTCASLRHPVIPDLPCPVLQYADDTLILIPGTMDAVLALRGVLDSFSNATVLAINFHKSTFAPLHIDPETASALASAFGSSVSSFPQTYLGLPLAPTRLLVSDFAPLVASFDRYL
jgi:hypothetical protein